jgi:hypothetical protein
MPSEDRVPSAAPDTKGLTGSLIGRAVECSERVVAEPPWQV